MLDEDLPLSDYEEACAIAVGASAKLATHRHVEALFRELQRTRVAFEHARSFAAAVNDRLNALDAKISATLEES